MWKHKKYKSTFWGRYDRDKAGERVFLLITDGPWARRITFESWQAAKKIGWVKFK